MPTQWPNVNVNDFIRRSGRSTRIVDNSIQKLFIDKTVTIRDHHHTREASLLVFNRVIKRLINERLIHESNLKITKSNLTISIIDENVWIIKK